VRACPAAAGTDATGAAAAARSGSVSLPDTIIRSRLGPRARSTARPGRARHEEEKGGAVRGRGRETNSCDTRDGSGVGCSDLPKGRARADTITRPRSSSPRRGGRDHPGGRARRGPPAGRARPDVRLLLLLPANRRLGWLARGAPRPLCLRGLADG
jgi:hypothetical protein